MSFEQERALRARALVEAEARARAESRRRLPILRLEIASPCEASWDQMVGDQKTRFCLACEKNVHDLTAMSAEEVGSFLAVPANAQACIRIFQRVDGTVMRENCPMGISRRRLRGVLLSGLSLAAVALGCFTGLALLHAREAQAKETTSFETSMPSSHIPQRKPGFLTVLAPPTGIVVVDGNALGPNVVGVPLDAGLPHFVSVIDTKTGFQASDSVKLAEGESRTLSLFPNPVVTLAGGPIPLEPARAIRSGKLAGR